MSEISEREERVESLNSEKYPLLIFGECFHYSQAHLLEQTTYRCRIRASWAVGALDDFRLVNIFFIPRSSIFPNRAMRGNWKSFAFDSILRSPSEARWIESLSLSLSLSLGSTVAEPELRVLIDQT